MVKLADTLDLGSSASGREGSSPFIRIELYLVREECDQGEHCEPLNSEMVQRYLDERKSRSAEEEIQGADLAQLVEHLICNQRVACSNHVVGIDELRLV